MGFLSDLFKKSFVETNLLEDAVEMHCHLLPGVDDGAKTIKNTLNSLAIYQKLGYKHIVFTPHIMVDWPKNNPEYLTARLAEIREELPQDLKISLAAEYMLDTNFMSHVEEKNLLTYDGKHVLIETSYLSPPTNMGRQIYELRVAGYEPILAHPERYIYMDEKQYRSLKQEDINFQLNLFALLGGYGSTAKKKALYLLRSGFYNFVGTDTHRSQWLGRGMEDLKLSKKDIQLLKPLFENTKKLISK